MTSLRTLGLMTALLLPTLAFGQEEFVGDYELDGRYTNGRGTAVEVSITMNGDEAEATRYAVWTARRYRDMDEIVWKSTASEVRGKWLIVTYALESDLTDPGANLLDGLTRNSDRDEVLEALMPSTNIFRAAYYVKSDGTTREYVNNMTRLGDDRWWRYITSEGIRLDSAPPPVSSDLPASWAAPLADEMAKPYFVKLQQFVAKQRETEEIFPPADQVYSAFHLTPYDKVKVVILGQDPYHDNGQAHGLAFSMPGGFDVPPSLYNIYNEYETDLGHRRPVTANLEPWAKEGVLLLNAVLTVRAHEANSHKGQGWETFTNEVIRAINRKDDRVVFVLWGSTARKKKSMIDTSKHTIIESHHPSPLSSWRTGPLGFYGSKFFSRANDALEGAGRSKIDWKLD